MAQDVEKIASQEEDDYGEIFFQWKIPQFQVFERSFYWYILMIVVAVLLLIYCFLTKNIYFGLIIILGVFVIFLKTYNAPRMLTFKITEDGLVVGRQFIKYSNINSFYFIYRPPVKKIFFDLKSVAPDFSVPLGDLNPLAVREKLLEYLVEDVEKEYQSFDDQIETILKL